MNFRGRIEKCVAGWHQPKIDVLQRGTHSHIIMSRSVDNDEIVVLLVRITAGVLSGGYHALPTGVILVQQGCSHGGGSIRIAREIGVSMRILLVEDNEDLGEAIEKRLRSAGHSVEWVRDGAHVAESAEGDEFDAMVLDLMLPNRDGISLIAELRRRRFNAPILVITARSEIDDKVSLLDLGADDYLVKPFDLRELEARLRALMRRTGGLTSSVIGVGNLELDLAGLNATINGEILDLGRREFRLLEILVTHADKVVAKERLMNQLFNFDESVSVNALELHISRLRRKLEHADVKIATVRGVGYTMRASGR